MGLKNSHPKLFPGDIVEYPRNKYFSHFGIYFGERDGVPYVAHLTCRDSDTKIPLFGRALRAEVKLDPVELLGNKYKVNNMLDDTHTARDFHTVVKPAIEDMLGREVTFDILFHNSEHQVTLFRYGVKKSQQVRRVGGAYTPGLQWNTVVICVCVSQIEQVYEHIMPSWKKLFKEKKL
ncbi:phospholipase A and acyltransferase 1 isoform X2 [Kryptolebias marmoratus]|uniref:phospholipase A and acyltransferase 1 isoform X2 n=1 Tax=Kryptolebias marmoratus TaxID=37003 RepID=UPI0018ACC2EF|nr:phospholipase A and acyltransferase 1 isoform X2 [Kryptolebias marmoratus]